MPVPVPQHEDMFDTARLAYPKRPGASWSDARKAWNARIKAGHTEVEMLTGVLAYAAYVKATNTEPPFIKHPATFFGPGLHFQSDWSVIEEATKDVRHGLLEFYQQEKLV